MANSPPSVDFGLFLRGCIVSHLSPLCQAGGGGGVRVGDEVVAVDARAASEPNVQDLFANGGAAIAVTFRRIRDHEWTFEVMLERISQEQSLLWQSTRSLAIHDVNLENPNIASTHSLPSVRSINNNNFPMINNSPPPPVPNNSSSSVNNNNNNNNPNNNNTVSSPSSRAVGDLISRSNFFPDSNLNSINNNNNINYSQERPLNVGSYRGVERNNNRSFEHIPAVRSTGNIHSYGHNNNNNNNNNSTASTAVVLSTRQLSSSITDSSTTTTTTTSSSVSSLYQQQQQQQQQQPSPQRNLPYSLAPQHMSNNNTSTSASMPARMLPSTIHNTTNANTESVLSLAAFESLQAKMFFLSQENSKLETFRGRCRDLEGELEKTRGQLQDAISRSVLAEESQRKYRTMYDEHRAIYDDQIAYLRKLSEETGGGLKQALEDLESSKAVLQQHKEKCKKKRANLKEELAKTKEALANGEAKFSVEQGPRDAALRSLQEEVAVQRQRIVELAQELEIANRTREEMGGELGAALRATRDAAKERAEAVAAERKRSQELALLLAAAKQQILEMEQMNADPTGASLQSKLSSAVMRASSLQTRLSNAERALDETKNIIFDRSNAVSELQQRVKDSESEAESAKAHWVHLDNALHAMEEEKSKLMKELDEMRGHATRLQTDVDRMVEGMGFEQEKRDDQQQQQQQQQQHVVNDEDKMAYANWGVERQQMEARIHELSGELKVQTDLLERWRGAAEAAKETIDNHVEALSVCRRDLEIAHNKIRELEETQRCIATAAIGEQEIANLKEERDSLQQLLTQTQIAVDLSREREKEVQRQLDEERHSMSMLKQLLAANAVNDGNLSHRTPRETEVESECERLRKENWAAHERIVKLETELSCLETSKRMAISDSADEGPAAPSDDFLALQRQVFEMTEWNKTLLQQHEALQQRLDAVEVNGAADEESRSELELSKSQLQMALLSRVRDLELELADAREGFSRRLAKLYEDSVWHRKTTADLEQELNKARAERDSQVGMCARLEMQLQFEQVRQSEVEKSLAISHERIRALEQLINVNI